MQISEEARLLPKALAQKISHKEDQNALIAECFQQATFKYGWTQIVFLASELGAASNRRLFVSREQIGRIAIYRDATRSA